MQFASIVAFKYAALTANFQNVRGSDVTEDGESILLSSF